MTAQVTEFKALVLSPIASHPQDYGNRNRILQMTRFFKELGYEIHFVFYPIESDWERGIPPSAKEMRAAWDSFTIIPPTRPLHQQAVGEHHQIDEWWDPAVGKYLDWLFKREFFDVMLVNYTYFAKAFEHAPRATVKVLEMHDLFSGRKEMLAAQGVGPDFFYTLPDQERVAFDRADIVIAIKDGEAKIVRDMTKKPVAVSVPFYMAERPARQRPERLLPTEDLRVGFLGANNVVNVVNMRRFLETFGWSQRIYVPNLSLSIAGNVAYQLQSGAPGVKLLGRVEYIENFYDEIDVVVAPLMFSTGIKIKVGEALSFGKPVVATENGFDGYSPTDKFHTLKNYEEVCRALVSLAYDRSRLKTLESRSSLAAQLARHNYANGCRSLAMAVKRLSKMIVLVTDQPIWSAGTPQQERLAQWIQLFTYMGRAAVLYVGSAPIEVPTRDDLSMVKFIDLSGAHDKLESASRALEEFDRTHTIIELVISAGKQLGQSLWERLQERFTYVTLDLWVPDLARIAKMDSGDAAANVCLTERNGTAKRNAIPLSLNALRYEPYGLRGWARGQRSTEIWIARCNPAANEQAGIDLLSAMMNGTIPVSTVDLDLFADSFDSLRGRPPPSLIVAVGRDRRMADVWRSVAQQAGIGCVDLSEADFPILVEAENGSTSLCSTYADVARHLTGSSGYVSQEAAHSGDTGWHTYWNLVAKR